MSFFKVGQYLHNIHHCYLFRTRYLSYSQNKLLAVIQHIKLLLADTLTKSLRKKKEVVKSNTCLQLHNSILTL